MFIGSKFELSILFIINDIDVMECNYVSDNINIYLIFVIDLGNSIIFGGMLEVYLIEIIDFVFIDVKNSDII